MLRMYFIEQRYGLADVAVEDAIYDSQALRNFCGIDLAVASVPDSTTLMDFCHLLEKNALPQAMLKEVNALLKKGNQWHFGMKAHTLVPMSNPAWCTPS